MLNLHQVRIFTTVVESRTFSAAAEVLSVSQPALSKAVQELETQLGMTLLVRTRRGVKLTREGEVLYAHARQLFAVERAAESALDELKGLLRGHLFVGASSTIGIYMLPALLGTYHHRYPQIELFLDIGNTQQIVEHLLEHQLDVAFAEGPINEPSLMVIPWQEDELVVIAAPDHPLTRKSSLTVYALADTPLIVRESGSGTREVGMAALAEHGVYPPIAMELASTEAVKQAVSARLGIAVVSTATIQMEIALHKLVVLPVEGLTIRRSLTCLLHPELLPPRPVIAWLDHIGISPPL
jgi:DNA-binding transcriptional LysR family regulator